MALLKLSLPEKSGEENTGTGKEISRRRRCQNCGGRLAKIGRKDERQTRYRRNRDPCHLRGIAQPSQHATILSGPRRATGEELRLKYRYLDLRRKSMQQTLILRSRIIKAMRDYFEQHQFIDVETPILGRSTPEGARDYLVPSRVHKNHFFALPQSPQLYKQILMVAGYDRYIQVARCFRDEDLRADRQPEFTQLDLEMSFIDNEDIIGMIDGLMAKLAKDILGIELKLPLLA